MSDSVRVLIVVFNLFSVKAGNVLNLFLDFEQIW